MMSWRSLFLGYIMSAKAEADGRAIRTGLAGRGFWARHMGLYLLIFYALSPED
jgi:hypothetical protein